MSITLIPTPAPSTTAPALAGLALRPGSVTVVHGATAADTRSALAALTAPDACPGRFTVVARRSVVGVRSVTLSTLVAPLPTIGRFTTVAGYLHRAATAAPLAVLGLTAVDVLDRLGLRPFARQHISQLSSDQRTMIEIGASIAAGVGHRIVVDLQAAALDAVALRRVMELLADAVRECTAVVVGSDDTEWSDLIASELVVVAAGRVLAQGAPSTIAGRGQQISTVTWQGPDGLHEHRTRAPGAVVAELELHFGREVSAISVRPPRLGDVVADIIAAA